MADTRVTTGIVEMPGHWMARAGDVIGYRGNGQPITLIGGADDDDDDADDDGGADDDQDADVDGDRDDLDDILDDLDGDGDGDRDDDDRDDDRSGRRRRGRRGSGSGRRRRRGDRDDDDDDRWDQMNRRLDRLANRIAHGSGRRRDRDDDRSRDRRPASRDRNDRDRDDDRRPDRVDTGPDPADVREARLSFRGYLTDHDVVGSEEARRMAGVLGSAMIPTMLHDSDDPDEVGRRAARQVARTLEDYTRTVQRDTVRALRRRGRLRDAPDRGDGTGAGAGTANGLGSGRAIRAAVSRADQINQARGRGGKPKTTTSAAS